MVNPDEALSEESRLRAQLEQVTRERDAATAEAAGLRERVAKAVEDALWRCDHNAFKKACGHCLFDEFAALSPEPKEGSR